MELEGKRSIQKKNIQNLIVIKEEPELFSRITLIGEEEEEEENDSKSNIFKKKGNVSR